MARPQSCPRCSSIEIYRSHRGIVEHLLIGCRAFRCASCKGRFRVFNVRNVLRRQSSTFSAFSTFVG
jgi:hypothetical protein